MTPLPSVNSPRSFGRRWTVQPDPGIWVCRADLPVHMHLAHSLELGQALLRASRHLHKTLSLAGFPTTQPVRSVDSCASYAAIRDSFALGLDESRIAVCLQIRVEANGRLTSSLTAANPVLEAGSSGEIPKLYAANQTLGSFSWGSALISIEQYRKSALIAQLAKLGLDEAETVVPREWQEVLLDLLEP